jgi:hypothetical protein
VEALKLARAGLLLAALCSPGVVRAEVPTLHSSEPALRQLFELIGPTLDANRRELRGVTGRVLGFGAGDEYPQIWIRDSATLVPVIRYLYPRERLVSWLEEHFAHQRPDGSLFDWIAAGPVEHFARWAPQAVRIADRPLAADRNTVEADQETSAVLAALAIYEITGDRDWLLAEVAGRPLLWRCQDALQYLVRRRYDRLSGLVTSGFSADWGDVSPLYPDQRAIYLDDRTPRVLGLYTNGLFYGAATALRDVLAELGHAGRAAYWDQLATRVHDFVNGELWRERRGFYGMHRLLAAAPGPGWSDPDRFAMGGNAVAALHGLADRVRSARIVDAAARAARQSGASTVAGVLQPPFPRGFFRHGALSEPYRYQNGGQWDWFAGRLLLVAFENGRSALATDQLLAIAKKAVANGGLYEWHDLAGVGRGSASYAGSAGALGRALIEGLYGVHLSDRRLELWVRLGERSGGVSLREPTTGVTVSYRYAFDGERVNLDLASSHAQPGRIGVLLPPGRAAANASLAGRPSAFGTLEVGADTYATVDVTAWSETRLVIELAPEPGRKVHP